MEKEYLKIIHDQCTLCKDCITSCPSQALEVIEEKIVLKEQLCSYCMLCIDTCSVNAIERAVEKKDNPDLASYKNIWIFIEHHNGQVEDVVFELLQKGKELARELKSELCGVLLGNKTKQLQEELLTWGFNKIYTVDKPELEVFNDQIYARVMADLIKTHKPAIVLCGATTLGRSFISRTAVLGKTGLTADCTELKIDSESGNLIQIRPAFGGNIMAEIITPHTRPQIATVRPHVFTRSSKAAKAMGEVIYNEVKEQSLQSEVELLDFIPEKSQTASIADARIVIAGGKGMQSPENFLLLEELAKVLKAGIGASRSVVDLDWISYSHQIGQTGTTISPKIYIACGISGQIQHLVGMSSAETIIAVNTDKNAPIFDIASYGIVGDALKILPQLTEEFKKILS